MRNREVSGIVSWDAYFIRGSSVLESAYLKPPPSLTLAYHVHLKSKATW